DGKRTLADNIDQVARFQSAGWNATHIDGHDPKAILDAIHAAQNSDKPTMIACKTTIGFGAPTKAGTNKAHSDALGEAEVAGTRKNLNWPYPPFVIPDDILAVWRKAGSRGSTQRSAPSSNGECAGTCRTTSIRSLTPTSRSSPRKSRKSRPARRAKRRSTSSGPPCPSLSPVRPT